MIYAREAIDITSSCVCAIEIASYDVIMCTLLLSVCTFACYFYSERWRVATVVVWSAACVCIVYPHDHGGRRNDSVMDKRRP